MNDFKNFLLKYRGALIGLLIAILLLALQIYKVIVAIIIIIVCMIAGNFIQQNKELVKDKMKDFIDRF